MHKSNSGSYQARDYSGVRINNYLLVSDTGKKDKKGSHIWLAKCDCGNTFEVASSRMKRVKSCGCLAKTSFYEDNTCDIPGEEWRPIQGYDNYLVSNKGRIKSLCYLGHPGVERIMSPGVDAKGYIRISLTKDGTRITRKVHRLVAEAFISNPEGKPEVNHIDGNKQNNCIENLEWNTPSENLKNAYDTGLKEKNRAYARVLGSKYGKKNIQKYIESKKMKVIAIDVKTGEEKRFLSQTEAAKALGVCKSNINQVLSGKRKSLGGYYFRKDGGDAT